VVPIPTFYRLSQGDHSKTPERREAARKRSGAQWRAAFKSGKRTLKRFSAEEIALVKTLRAKGAPLMWISRKTGMSLSYVCNVLAGRARAKDAGPDVPRDDTAEQYVSALSMYGESMELLRAGDSAGAAEIAKEIVRRFGPGKPSTSP
jgi:hypothetical protein